MEDMKQMFGLVLSPTLGPVALLNFKRTAQLDGSYKAVFSAHITAEPSLKIAQQRYDTRKRFASFFGGEPVQIDANAPSRYNDEPVMLKKHLGEPQIFGHVVAFKGVPKFRVTDAKFSLQNGRYDVEVSDANAIMFIDPEKVGINGVSQVSHGLGHLFDKNSFSTLKEATARLEEIADELKANAKFLRDRHAEMKFIEDTKVIFDGNDLQDLSLYFEGRTQTISPYELGRALLNCVHENFLSGVEREALTAKRLELERELARINEKLGKTA